MARNVAQADASVKAGNQLLAFSLFFVFDWVCWVVKGFKKYGFWLKSWDFGYFDK
jgi:hypothetical protein